MLLFYAVPSTNQSHQHNSYSKRLLELNVRIGPSQKEQWQQVSQKFKDCKMWDGEDNGWDLGCATLEQAATILEKASKIKADKDEDCAAAPCEIEIEFSNAWF